MTLDAMEDANCLRSYYKSYPRNDVEHYGTLERNERWNEKLALKLQNRTQRTKCPCYYT